ncbi:hypothetical protein [Polaromonas sp. AER18D-145]|uniref:hypothetical protein n=1 Tax=Polaromonas sp. AER18D-145 TaxID=1977060 RepID=UPI000BBCAA69|nr:hypothetical protein [Polaromonas sp. AER18D-145]
MASKEVAAQLALYVYNVTRNLENRPELPDGWARLEYHPDDAIGFSYGVFQNSATGEVVVSFTGTNEKQVADFLLANLPAGVGLSSLQVNAAARVAANAISTYGASNVTFAGHSLGGGLASIMGVWFDRPSTVFDPAPFEATARNPLAVLSARNWISLTTGLSNPALNSFEVLGNFTQREAAVTSYYSSEEALQLLRMFLPTVTGTENRVEFGVDNMLSRRIDLHSQALLTAGLMSESFRVSTIAVQRSIPLMMDGNLYAYDVASSNQRNFLIDLIRSEQGTGDKLTHFASDLNKLGTNIVGLNKQAQDAIIAQGIEWYYWQDKDYAGKEFFTQTGALLQYTLAQSEVKADGTSLTNLNKAAIYAKLWLDPKAAAHGAYGVGTSYEQWNVNTGTSAVTATALNLDKNQIFIGNFAAETFTGGNKNDVLLADDGEDTLDGGKGDDKLYGGTGTDTYVFTSTDLAGWGTDTIVDSDGTGIIKIDADTLSGGKSISPLLGRAWISDDKKYQFQFKPNALTPAGTAADSTGVFITHGTGAEKIKNDRINSNKRPTEKGYQHKLCKPAVSRRAITRDLSGGIDARSRMQTHRHFNTEKRVHA